MVPFLRPLSIVLLLAGALVGTTPGASPSASMHDFEVWLIDQSDSPGKEFGGTIHVYNGVDLTGDSAESAAPVDTLDLSAETATLCMESTGANPVRPHMLTFNSTYSHAILSFVASGHVVIFDAVSRSPVACLRASAGYEGNRQAHAATPAPDDSYILVANQNGKLLERIDADFANDSFRLNPDATIDLATCATPSGAACEDATLRPDNAPIVPVIDSTSSLGFITLRGGGMFVVDPRSTPMQIIGEYDSNTIRGNGFAGVQANGSVFVNSGGGTAANMDGFDVYAFPVTGYDPANGPNSPAPVLLFSDDDAERDSHGLALLTQGRYLWVLDRIQNVAEVFETATGKRVNTIDLNQGGPDGLAPDLADVSPDGNYVFVSLRGPTPLSGDPHASMGSTPGIGVIQVSELGMAGLLEHVVSIQNHDANHVEHADAHGIRVRLT